MLNNNDRAVVNRYGAISLLFPYGAGRYRAYECSRIKVLYSSTTNQGGIRVGIDIGQKLFCPVRYLSRFEYKKPNNPTTRYDLYSNGQVVKIKGTAGLIGPAGDDGAIFVIEQGAVFAIASNGETGVIEQGQIGIASDAGLVIFEQPKLVYDVAWRDKNQAVITFPLGLTAIVDGKEIQNGDVVWNPFIIELKGPLGQENVSERVYRPVRP